MGVTIDGLPECVSPAVGDEIEVCTLAAPRASKRLSFTRLIALILGGRTIGGNADADIPTNASVGTFKNKTLLNPVLNGSALNATGDQLDTLIGVTATVNDHNLLSGAHAAGVRASDVLNIANSNGNFQDQLEELQGMMAYHYHDTITLGGGVTVYSINPVTVLTALGIDHLVFCIVAGSTTLQWMTVDAVTGAQSACAAVIDKWENLDGALKNIDLKSFAAGQRFNYVMTFRIAKIV